MYTANSNKEKDILKNNTINIANNPIANDSTLLAYYTDSSKYNEIEIFDKAYEQALELMGGDRLLKPAGSVNLVTIRKTTTRGLYKLILNSPEFKIKVRHIDEGELINNRELCAGTLSKLDDDSYEITYFDSEDEIVIEHFSKKEVIDFMNKNKLVFQI